MSIELRLPDAEVERIARAVVAQLAQAPKAELLTPAQVAAKTGLSLKALERRRSRNQPPLSVKRGGRVFYTGAAVHEFIEGSQP